MIDTLKIKKFIESLSDNELNEQVDNFSLFVEVYRKLLLDEKDSRIDTTTPATDSTDLLDTNENTDYSKNLNNSSLTFDVIVAIKEKISRFSDNELVEQMNELDEILKNSSNMPQEILEQYLFAQETCELKYFESFGSVPQACGSCGSFVLPGQTYCGKCGNKI